MSLTAVATYACLGLTWTPPADPGSAGVDVRYRAASSGTWIAGYPLWFDARNNQARGSLINLQAGTSYVVQVKMPAASWPGTELTASTWAASPPIGTTVTVASRSTTLSITSGGTAGAWKCYDGRGATIDLAHAAQNCILVAAPYVVIRNFVLKGAQYDGIRLWEGAHDVVIEDCDISDFGTYSRTVTEGAVTVQQSVHGCSGIHAKAQYGGVEVPSMERFTVQRCTIHDPTYSSISWSTDHPAGPVGIYFENIGGNHVLRWNDIHSDGNGHYYMDGIGGEDNFTLTGAFNHDSDIYGNRVSRCWDDGIECEGGNKNNRIWGNYLDQTCTGIASTVCAIGPIYIFRNVYNRSRQLQAVAPDADDRNGFAKAGTLDSTIGDGRRYLFHNTTLQATAPGNTYPLGTSFGASGVAGGAQPVTNTVSRNNIWHIWKSGWEVFAQSGSGNAYDYDLYSGTVAGGDETHGLHGTPTYAAGHGWTDEAGGHYQLANGSSGTGAGAWLPNFNVDTFLGWTPSSGAPDMGAAQRGRAPMLFGPAAADPAPGAGVAPDLTGSACTQTASSSPGALPHTLAGSASAQAHASPGGPLGYSLQAAATTQTATSSGGPITYEASGTAPARASLLGLDLAYVVGPYACVPARSDVDTTTLDTVGSTGPLVAYLPITGVWIPGDAAGATTTQSATSPGGALTQDHALSGTASEQGAASGYDQALSADDCSQANDSPGGAVAPIMPLIGTLDAEACTQLNRTSSATFAGGGGAAWGGTPSLTLYPGPPCSDGSCLVAFDGPPEASVVWTVTAGDGSTSGHTPATDATGRAWATYSPDGGSGTATVEVQYGA